MLMKEGAAILNVKEAPFERLQDPQSNLNNVMASIKNKNVQRHTIRKLWKIHFSMGLIVLCLGMMCNGGRYVARPMDDRRNTFYAQCNDSKSF